VSENAPKPDPLGLRLTIQLDMDDLRAVASATKRREDMMPVPEGDSDAVGALIAEICRGWMEMLDHSASRPSTPSPIEINPDVAALLDRLETEARYRSNATSVAFDPQHADDLRKAVELIRFGRRATGQPDAGRGEDDSR
jgi:hypothetical protein